MSLSPLASGTDSAHDVLEQHLMAREAVKQIFTVSYHLSEQCRDIDSDASKNLRELMHKDVQAAFEELKCDGREYDLHLHWIEGSVADDWLHNVITLKLRAVAWLVNWQDCNIGEMTDDPRLSSQSDIVRIAHASEVDETQLDKYSPHSTAQHEIWKFRRLNKGELGKGFVRVE